MKKEEREKYSWKENEDDKDMIDFYYDGKKYGDWYKYANSDYPEDLTIERDLSLLIDIGVKIGKAMQLQSNWISVEDRLPEEIERYLVVVERPDEMHPSVKTANRYIHKPAVNDRRMDANFIIHGRVTHWQPLPQPPKE